MRDCDCWHWRWRSADDMIMIQVFNVIIGVEAELI